MSKLKPGRTASKNSREVGRRDAFHVPGILVLSDHEMKPGQDIRLTYDCKKAVPCSRTERQAIVDPFLDPDVDTTAVAFWACVVPDVVTDLTHHFEIGNTGSPRDYFVGKGFESVDSDEDDGCRSC